MALGGTLRGPGLHDRAVGWNGAKEVEKILESEVLLIDEFTLV
jgi:hypothetical protein